MNILVTGSWAEAKNNISHIEKFGHKVKFLQYEKDQIPCSYDWIEGVVCNGLFLFHPIEKFSRLRYIQLTSVGYDRVPIEYISQHNIEIYNAKGVYSVSMAEYAVAGVLELYKNMNFFYENKKKRIWEKNRNIRELYGKNVCILGSGNVGTECAKRFKCFGCNIYGLDLNPRDDENYLSIAPISKVNELLSLADIVIVTLPLTADTYHILDADKMTHIKNDAIIVNISRGSVVDSQAITACLLSGKLGGAVLDVFENEPLDSENVLWNMKNVIITPHNSFVGENNSNRLNQLILNNLENEGKN